jgi:hypothetical protein
LDAFVGRTYLATPHHFREYSFIPPQVADMEAEFSELHHFIGQATAASWPFFAIATIIFGMRSVSRIWFMEASYGWEDLIISVSYVCEPVVDSNS